MEEPLLLSNDLLEEQGLPPWMMQQGQPVLPSPDAVVAEEGQEEDCSSSGEEQHQHHEDPDNSNQSTKSPSTLSTAGARFNMLSTMVGGGALSLPYAFYHSGNGFVGPLLLCLVAWMMEQGSRLLIQSFEITVLLAKQQSCTSQVPQDTDEESTSSLGPPRHTTTTPRRTKQEQQEQSQHHTSEREHTVTRQINDNRLHDTSLEGIVREALGYKAYHACQVLILLFCYCTIVGYVILLRDLLLKVHSQSHAHESPTDSFLHDDSSFSWTVVMSKVWRYVQSWDYLWWFLALVAVTPLSALPTLTALHRLSALSMISITIVAVCLVYKSLECHFADINSAKSEQGHVVIWKNMVHSWMESFHLWPADAWWEIRRVVPIYIYCYVCHFNVNKIHSAFRHPTPKRVAWWLRSTTGLATCLYLILGWAGSTYGASPSCHSGDLSANILVDLESGNEGEDILLKIMRRCMVVTISLALPMLVLPTRNILVQLLLMEDKGDALVASRGDSFAADGAMTEDDYSADEESSNYNHMMEEGVGMDAQDRNYWETGRNPFAVEDVSVGSTSSGEGSVSYRNDVGIDDDLSSTPLDETKRPSFWMRLGLAFAILGSASLIALVVPSVKVVWDILGSSLSILLALLIPSISFLALHARLTKSLAMATGSDVDNSFEGIVANDYVNQFWQTKVVAWLLIVVFVPALFFFAGDAVYSVAL